MICRNSRYRYGFFLATLLALGPIRADAGELFTHEPIDWQIEIPEGWVLTPEHIAAEARESGREAIEEMLDEEVKGDPVSVLYLHSDSGTFTADAIDFIESRDGPFAQSTKLVFDMAVYAIEAQDIPFEGRYSTLDIGGVEFSTLEVTMFADDGRTAEGFFMMFDGLVDKTGLTISYACFVPSDCSDIRESILSSKFGR